MLQNNDIYKNENIKLNTDWLNSISDSSSSLITEVEVFDPISEHLSNDDDEASIVAEVHSAEAMTTENNDTNVGSSSSHNDNIQKLSDVEHMNTDINNDNVMIWKEYSRALIFLYCSNTLTTL